MQLLTSAAADINAALAIRRTELAAVRWTPAQSERPACHVTYNPSELSMTHPPVTEMSARSASDNPRSNAPRSVGVAEAIAAQEAEIGRAHV